MQVSKNLRSRSSTRQCTALCTLHNNNSSFKDCSSNTQILNLGIKEDWNETHSSKRIWGLESAAFVRLVCFFSFKISNFKFNLFECCQTHKAEDQSFWSFNIWESGLWMFLRDLRLPNNAAIFATAEIMQRPWHIWIFLGIAVLTERAFSSILKPFYQLRFISSMEISLVSIHGHLVRNMLYIFLMTTGLFLSIFYFFTTRFRLEKPF